MAVASQQGTLQSGNMLLSVKNEYDRAASENSDKIVRLAFELTGSTAQPVCDTVEQGLRLLRDALSSDLAQFFRVQGAFAPRDTTDGLSNDFLHTMDKRITAIVDDLRHGIAGGARLSKDPLVSVISNITNSPGAVVQGGVGNVQRVVTSGASNDIRSALTQFMASAEVLSAENRQSLADVAEVIEGELQNPKPDAAKLARWGKRLIDLAERLGIAVARISEPRKGKYGLRFDINHRQSRFRFFQPVYLFVRGDQQLADPNSWTAARHILVRGSKSRSAFHAAMPPR
jgi:hypothetical protein